MLVGRRYAVEVQVGRGVAGFIQVDEDAQVVAHQPGAERDGFPGRDRAVGPHLDGELVVVGDLSEAGRFHEILDLAHRRVDGVDGNPADTEVLVEVLLGGNIAAALLDPQLHVQRAAVGHRRDVGVGVENLHRGVGFEMRRLDLARLVGPQVQRLRLVGVQLDGDLLQVQDDVGRVLDHSRNRRELVEHVVDLDAGDRGALYRGQEHPAQRVADRGPETALERLGGKPAEPIGQGLRVEIQPFRPLEVFPQHQCHSFLGPGPLLYFEYNSTINCSCTGRLIWSRVGSEATRPVMVDASNSSQPGIPRPLTSSMA